jgi:serine protease AprX
LSLSNPMRLLHAFILIVSLAGTLAHAQRSRVWIQFRDRETTLLPADPQVLGITERALARRAKVLPRDHLVDALDLPPPSQYLQAIQSTGVTIRAVSRWLNAVSVEATPEQLARCSELPFVKSLQPVGVFSKKRPEVVELPTLPKRTLSATIDYGPSFTQLNNIKVVDVHNLGINGSGVLVGMVDDGYNNHRMHNAMKNIRVLAEYDFIQRDTNTSRAPGEYLAQGQHGAYTLSALAGFENGRLVGPAYGASLLLAKTEIDSVEIRIEEDLYVEGLEWLERMGAEIVSSSLGYIDWYTFRDLDGKTATTTKAALVAARKGVLLVTAAGNEGHYRTRNPDSTGTLIAPADADSIVTVGAVSSTGIIAGFSSTGPTFDGRVKPEVVAQGVSVYSANGSTLTEYAFVSGTSLSTPLTAGVAALVLSAHPYLTPMQVREALIRTTQRVNDGARTATWPNNFYGYGMVNALEAVLYHGLVFSNRPFVLQQGNQLTVTVSIASKIPLVPDSLLLYYRSAPGGAFTRVRLNPTGQPNSYAATLPAPIGQDVLQAYFSARDSSGRVRTSPYNAPDSLFLLKPDSISSAPTLVPEQFILYPNYPNPFNAGTVFRFDAPEATDVELAIYNILGQKVRTLFSGRCTQGVNRVLWNDGRSNDGTPIASGVYFYRLTTPTVTLTGKLTYLR